MIIPNHSQKFRLVKVQLEDGSWKPLPKTYKTSEELGKAVKPFGKLKGVFSSCSLWYNPTALEFEYKDKPLFLKSDLVIDIDDEDSKDSFKESLGVKAYLEQKPELRFEKHLRSGGGFHVIFQIIKYPKISNPEERMEWFTNYKESVCNELLKAGFAGIDYGQKPDRPFSKVSSSIHQVTRMEGSPHPSGETCRRVMESYVPEPRQENADEKNNRPEIPADIPMLGKDVSFYFIRRSVTNNVCGFKDAFIPYAELPHTQSSIIRLRKAQEVYNLGNFYLTLLPENKIGAFCLSVVNHARLMKILTFLRSSNISTFQKYKLLWIPVADYKTRKEKLRSYVPITTLHNKVEGMFSEYHKVLLHPYPSLKDVPLKKVIQIMKA